MIGVNVLYKQGVRLEVPELKFGDLKRYQDKSKAYSKPYLMLRNSEGVSLLPPLYNYDDIFMKDGGLTIIFRGTERVKEEDLIKEYLQEWEVEFCTDTDIFTKIEKYTSGVERKHRENE